MMREISSLRQQKDQLEDTVLEAMEEAGRMGADQEELHSEMAELEHKIIRLGSDLDAVDADLAEVEKEHLERGRSLAALRPPDLMGHYERLRSKFGGVGAARFDSVRCTGCHLRLSVAELEAIRRAPPGSLLHCEQCGRILVR